MHKLVAAGELQLFPQSSSQTGAVTILAHVNLTLSKTPQNPLSMLELDFEQLTQWSAPVRPVDRRQN
jgi:hypothetical protein